MIRLTRRSALTGLAATTLTMAAHSTKAREDTQIYKVSKSDEEWRKSLTPEQYTVLRKHGTERAFTSALNAEKRSGTFLCAACGAPLFSSETKFDSGTGWPSFFKPIEGAIGIREDRSWLLQVRTEVHCARCGGHLGHVFEDGPKPTGLRYCMNGVAMTFQPAEKSAGN